MIYLSEDGINVVEVRLPRVGDEELTLVRVRPFTCHGHLHAEGLADNKTSLSRNATS